MEAKKYCITAVVLLAGFHLYLDSCIATEAKYFHRGTSVQPVDGPRGLSSNKQQSGQITIEWLRRFIGFTLTLLGMGLFLIGGLLECSFLYVVIVALLRVGLHVLVVSKHACDYVYWQDHSTALLGQAVLSFALFVVPWLLGRMMASFGSLESTSKGGTMSSEQRRAAMLYYDHVLERRSEQRRLERRGK